MSGATDIPTGFGFPVFLRIILPGIAGSVLLIYTFVPLFIPDWVNWGLDIKLIFLIFTGIILGTILLSSEFYIYQFYEGLRFWPKSLIEKINNLTLDEYRATVSRYRDLDKEYLFDWDNIPGDDERVLLDYLRKKFEIDCISTAKIVKIDEDKTIKVSTKNNYILLKLDDEESDVDLEICDGKTDIFKVKIKDNRKKNIL